MTYFKHAIACFVLASCLASPVFAQGENRDATYGENVVTFTTPGGTVVRKTVPANVMADMMTKGPMPMTQGVMMMMHQGKMYMVNDHKMPDGKMMSDMVMGK